jgi:predicted transcriptional regulator
LGILLNANSLKKIKFAKNDSIKSEDVGVTCETCSISDCEVRKAPPTRLEKEHFNESMKKAIAKIRKEVL